MPARASPAPPLVVAARLGPTGIGLLAALLAAVLLLATLGPAAAEPKRVLLLHSLGRDFAPFADVSGRFREELIRQSTDPVDYYEISLETARFAGAEQERPFVDYLQALFAQRRLDLVVPVGAPAARFAPRPCQRMVRPEIGRDMLKRRIRIRRRRTVAHGIH